MSLPQEFTDKLLDQNNDERPHESGLFRASVAVVIIKSTWSLLVIKRAKNENDPWSGHYGFPGGMVELGESTFEAVTRECHEEVGLQLSSQQLLGRLSPYSIKFIQGAQIFPFVFTCDETPQFLLDKTEVESVHLWSLKELLHPNSLVEKDFNTQLGTLKRPALVYENHIFWGISLGILNSLLEHWQGLLAPWGSTIRPFNLS